MPLAERGRGTSPRWNDGGTGAELQAEWAATALAALAGGPAALVTVLATEGSAPRGAGTRMVVAAGGAAGTIGGGRLEQQAIAQAVAMLDQPAGAWRVQDYPLGPLLGQCCGGRVRLLVERLDPARAGWLRAATPGARIVHRFAESHIDRHGGEAPAAAVRGDRPAPGDRIGERLDPPGRPLLLFGAGHVGRAIAAKAAGLPLALAWFDTRAEAAAWPGVALVAEADAPACARAAPVDAAILILTHDHALDYRLAAAALGGPARFVGLIGSATKRARFTARLARDGIDAARLTCPIGLPGIVGKAPEVIAVATLAQLLALA
ncbi:xanthine dehydrogenase accessory protein XdhC [Sphingomonas profundi]|uniref:xanthine dehydrogenase accessory protein XdhC n=1 Tax=Alterirhizorhabdus profundi TaxID=2681549 RepID=UPI0012E8900D|nr:xanthine dehydrogenase accessory protein XdhC [Sphingomonas profundi]